MFCFKVKLFLNSSQNGTYILMWKYKKIFFLNIVYNMGFKDKTYGLNILVVP
jgi:hypothetical protein